MQTKRAWNDNWQYRPDYHVGDEADNTNSKQWQSVSLPHTNQMMPYNCFDEAEYQFISCYRKCLQADAEMKKKRVYLDFEGVMIACEVFCNGVSAGSHEGGYTPFSIELTELLHEGENTIAVKVDSTERTDIPPFGGVVDYLTHGGIYREVFLRTEDSLRLENVRLVCKEPLAREKTLTAECRIETDVFAGEAMLYLRLKDRDGRLCGECKQHEQLLQGRQTVSMSLQGLEQLQLWSVESPVLYTVEIEICAGSLRTLGRERFGFRSARFTPQGFYLNNKHIKLIGLNRHQEWPYVGYAMPKRVQRRDAEMLKEMGCNMVRTSHYPQSRHFLDACDELGLLVMEEIPGWQHIGDLAWQAHTLQDVRDMIERDRNRPCIVLWGVRVNESQDHHDFYTETNWVAHELDDTRQTGGVRYLKNSELLEDVYTYNDFSHSGGKKIFQEQREATGLEHPVPILVTESNGHMFPTKRFDHEERRREHALRHLRVMNEVYRRSDLSGALSWCAFDYNTHSSFGSGDKICYHGVYDMFRNPKLAAFSYAVQQSPHKKPLLEPLTVSSRGERDGGGTVPFTVLTNCDFVRVYKNEQLIDDFYPDRELFDHIPHPPIVIHHLIEKKHSFGLSDDGERMLRHFLTKKLAQEKLLDLSNEDWKELEQIARQGELTAHALYGKAVRAAGGWGDAENALRLEGYVDGKCVCVREIGERKHYSELRAVPDSTLLKAFDDSYDAVRIAVHALDEKGNCCLFTQECVRVAIEGPAELMGPEMFPLAGGASAFWIKTTGQTGAVRVQVLGTVHKTVCELTVEA